MLEQELRYYNDHLADWLNTHANRFVVIKDTEVLGFFDTMDLALAEGTRRLGLTSFLARRIEPAQEPVQIPALALGILRGNSSSGSLRPAH